MSIQGKRASASAPASIGNVGIGFDVLGQAFDAARDRVTATTENEPGVRLDAVSGLVDHLPRTTSGNTALAAAAALLEAARAGFGVTLAIEKGIPVSAGMGGSAASAVAAVVAVNALLPDPLGHEDLLAFALEGERVSSDPPPWDNVVASLFGGLMMIAREKTPLIRPLPVPMGIEVVLVHPPVAIETRKARNLLRKTVPMHLAVEHSRRLAAFTLGCAMDDHDLIRAGFDDLLVEPQRVALLPALPKVKEAAFAEGALGCSFSGSGPSVFAWVPLDRAPAVEVAMMDAFRSCGLDARGYRAPLASEGARLEADRSQDAVAA